MPASQVFNIDCLEYLKTVPDKFFDLAIVDPPYGINADVNQNKGGVQFGFKKYSETNWDSQPPKKEYWNELFRVSQNQIVCGGNYFSEFLPPTMGWVVWDKIQRLSFSDGELIFTSFNKALRIWASGRGANQGFNNSERLHPTQKPVDLYKFLLHNYAKQGDKILDTHMGSQSSRIAAYEMGFDYWGTELDKDYFDAGNKRFELFKSQGKLF